MILHFSDISKLTFTHVTHRRSPTRHTAYVHDAAVQDARCTKHHTTTPRGKSGSDTHSSLKQRGARAEASRHRQRRRRAAAAAPPMNYVRTRAHATCTAATHSWFLKWMTPISLYTSGSFGQMAIACSKYYVRACVAPSVSTTAATVGRKGQDEAILWHVPVLQAARCSCARIPCRRTACKDGSQERALLPFDTLPAPGPTRPAVAVRVHRAER